MTMTSKKLKNHLIKRYNVKIVNKILALFDWSNSLYYKMFYTQFDKIITNSGAFTQQQDLASHTISLK